MTEQSTAPVGVCGCVSVRLRLCGWTGRASCEVGCESQVAGGLTSLHQQRSEALSLSRYTSSLGNALSLQNKHTSHLPLSLTRKRCQACNDKNTNRWPAANFTWHVDGWGKLQLTEVKTWGNSTMWWLQWACTCEKSCQSVSVAIKKWEMFMMITIGRQVGEALALAPLPLAVADIEVDRNRAGYSLVPVGRDLHNKRTLKYKRDTVRYPVITPHQNHIHLFSSL